MPRLASILGVTALLGALHVVHAHSWLECSDYDPVTDTCSGRARNWFRVMRGQSFGADMGRDNRPGEPLSQHVTLLMPDGGVRHPQPQH